VVNLRARSRFRITDRVQALNGLRLKKCKEQPMRHDERGSRAAQVTCREISLQKRAFQRSSERFMHSPGEGR
jgi:hypothetical protein